MTAGRPKIKFDYEQLEKLAMIGCTDAEIAAVLDISTKTIERRRKDDEEFCRALEKGRERGKASLRRMQWKAADGGNTTMMIWLGKQYLGQSDRRVSEITGKDGAPLIDSSVAERAIVEAAKRIERDEGE